MVRDAAVDVKGDFVESQSWKDQMWMAKMAAEPIIDSAASPSPSWVHPAGGSPCGLAILLTVARLVGVVRGHCSQQTVRFVVRSSGEIECIG